MRALDYLSDLRLDLTALLFPVDCASCGAPDRELCVACALSVIETGRVPRAEVIMGVPCFVAGEYAGPLRAAIVACKHGGSTGLARVLGEALRPALVAAASECAGPAAPVLVVPPSRAARVRERGFQHVELILGRALRASGIRALRVSALRAGRSRRSQQGLGRTERAANSARIGVRRTRARVISGRSVLLVDDVITTGSTLSAARDALEAAGSRVVACAALARA